MILKVLKDSGGWKFYDEIVEFWSVAGLYVSAHQDELIDNEDGPVVMKKNGVPDEMYMVDMVDMTRPTKNDDEFLALWAKKKDGGVFSMATQRSVYLLNNEGKTIERI